MAGRARFSAGPVAATAGSPEERWGGARADALISPGEEANPFSFKEFVRSKKQSAVLGSQPVRDVGLDPQEGGGSGSSSPKESSRFSFRLDSEASSPELLGLSLEFREPFFPDPVAESSLLEDEEEDWSSTYQPSAVEEAHSARASGTLLSSTSDLSDLQTFSPWQLGGSSSLPHAPLGKEEQSLPVDGAALGEDVYPPLRQSYEELKQENAKLRNLICHLQAVSETQAERVKQLERTLEESKRKEAQEAQDLEAMVQQVEENLQLMTKRAMKAESSAVKLKQENALLQVQMENCTLEKESLRASHSANLAVMKQNADIALQNLLTVVSKSRSSIKQLLSGAEALQLVAELLKSIDKISEIPKDSP